MATLRLKAPEVLPADGVTSVAFKAWKNALLSYLEQDTVNYLFLPGGAYSTWTPLAETPNRKRIHALSQQDPERIKLMRIRLSDEYSQDDRQAELDELLLKRNSQLSKLIQLIAVCCHFSEHDDIVNLSTSTDWIINYLLQHYNLERRGAHFLKVSEITYKEGTNHQTFYREFRSAIADNLKKPGHKVKYLNDKELIEDETFSPTFEEVIVLWCLEKIDHRLPQHVNKTFGHQMVGHVTLKDLQAQIFQRIPSMLEDLNDAEANRAAIHGSITTTGPKSGTNPEPTIAASRTFNRQQRNRPRRSPFCNVCKTAGKPPAVYESHYPSSCRLKSALLNSIIADNDDSDNDNSNLPFSTREDEDHIDTQ